MRRRQFIGLICGLATVTKLTPAHAERPSKLIVWISAFPVARGSGPLGFQSAFLKGMQDQGYVEARDFAFEVREGKGPQDVARVVEEAIQLRPDVIVAPATLEATAAKRATSTIPIVCGALADAVHLGLIGSEARPGGNVTGIEPYIGGLPAKQIDLSREVLPTALKIGLLTNNADPKGPPQLQELKLAAQALGLQVVSVNADRPEEIETGLQTLAKSNVDIVIVLQTNLLLINRAAVATSALEKRLATVYGYREHVAAGGLISYGVDLRWCYQRSAYFVAKILQGAKAGDLPIEFPTSLWLAVNLRTARALGLAVAPTLLTRADEVIE
jgi:putative tryptophan/tyrosine transport system substrate-binding protein